jgi:hypothetical protein
LNTKTPVPCGAGVQLCGVSRTLGEESLDVFATVETLPGGAELNRFGKLAGLDQTLAMRFRKKTVLVEISLSEKFLHGNLPPQDGAGCAA